MPRRLTFARPELASACAALMVVLLLAGALLWYLPALRQHRQPLAGVPTPPALFAATQFPLGGHQQACERGITVTPQSQLLRFTLFPAGRRKAGGPPVQVTLDGGGYRAQARLAGGYPGGIATLPFSPPRRTVVGTACFHNLGARRVLLVGTDEARTVSRSAPVTIAGRAVPGDVALSFLENRRVDVLHQTGDIAQHASNLTDGLLPPALIWIVGLMTAFGVPLSMVLALRAALREGSPGG